MALPFTLTDITGSERYKSLSPEEQQRVYLNYFRENIGQEVRSRASKAGIDPDLAQAMMLVESGGNIFARSPAGAVGPLQVMPATGQDLGYSDVSDPRQNIDAGLAYFKKQLDTFGNVTKALYAYNAGPGRALNPPSESQRYARLVQQSAANLKRIMQGEGGLPLPEYIERVEQLVARRTGQRPELIQGQLPSPATRAYEAVTGEPLISLPPPGVMPEEEWKREGPTAGEVVLPAALAAATIASAGMAAPATLPAIAGLTLSQLGGGLGAATLGSEATRRGLGALGEAVYGEGGREYGEKVGGEVGGLAAFPFGIRYGRPAARTMGAIEPEVLPPERTPSIPKARRPMGEPIDITPARAALQREEILPAPRRMLLAPEPEEVQLYRAAQEEAYPPYLPPKEPLPEMPPEIVLEPPGLMGQRQRQIMGWEPSPETPPATRLQVGPLSSERMKRMAEEERLGRRREMRPVSIIGETEAPEVALPVLETPLSASEKPLLPPPEREVLDKIGVSKVEEQAMRLPEPESTPLPPAPVVVTGQPRLAGRKRAAISPTDRLAVYVAKRGGVNFSALPGEAVRFKPSTKGVPVGVLSNKSQFSPDEMAEEAFRAGYISEPTEAAFLAALRRDVEAAAVGDERGMVFSLAGETKRADAFTLPAPKSPFENFKDDVVERAARHGIFLEGEQAERETLDTILGGYSSLEEAYRDALRLEETNGVRFSAEGFPISPQLLKAAVDRAGLLGVPEAVEEAEAILPTPPPQGEALSLEGEEQALPAPRTREQQVTLPGLERREMPRTAIKRPEGAPIEETELFGLERRQQIEEEARKQIELPETRPEVPPERPELPLERAVERLQKGRLKRIGEGDTGTFYDSEDGNVLSVVDTANPQYRGKQDQFAQELLNKQNALADLGVTVRRILTFADYPKLAGSIAYPSGKVPLLYSERLRDIKQARTVEELPDSLRQAVEKAKAEGWHIDLDKGEYGIDQKGNYRLVDVSEWFRLQPEPIVKPSEPALERPIPPEAIPEAIPEGESAVERREEALEEARKPWEMRGQNYSDYEADVLKQPHKPVSQQYKEWHKGRVRTALVEGRPVPSEVLAEYPDLAPKPIVPTPERPPERPMTREAIPDVIPGEERAVEPEITPPATAKEPWEKFTTSQLTKNELVNNISPEVGNNLLEVFGNEQRLADWLDSGGRDIRDLPPETVQNGRRIGLLVSDDVSGRRYLLTRSGERLLESGEDIYSTQAKTGVAKGGELSDTQTPRIVGTTPISGQISPPSPVQKGTPIPSMERPVVELSPELPATGEASQRVPGRGPETKIESRPPWMMTKREYIEGTVEELVRSGIPRDIAEIEAVTQVKFGAEAFPKNALTRHRDLVEDALSKNRPVPPEVLADYPDLISVPAAMLPDQESALILQTMLDIKPAAQRGALVYLPDLREALKAQFPDKESFDHTLMDLAQKGEIQLQSHDLPSVLTQAQKDAMVSNPQGSYYMAVGIRMEPGIGPLSQQAISGLRVPEKATTPAEANLVSEAQPTLAEEEAENLYNEVQTLLSKLPSDIGKAGREGKLSLNQQEAVRRLDEIERILPSTSEQWQQIWQRRRVEYDARVSVQRDEARKEGEAELARLGLNIGDRVYRPLLSMLGTTATRAEGVVKMGVDGVPYVQSSYQKGRLTLTGWKKSEPSVESLEAEGETLPALEEELPRSLEGIAPAKISPEISVSPPPAVQRLETTSPVAADLRKKADAMTSQIEAKLNPAIGEQRLTARRARIAGNIRAEGEFLQKVQAGLRAMADAWDGGTLPGSLQAVKTKRQVEIITRYEKWPSWDEDPQKSLSAAGITDEDKFTQARADLQSLTSGVSIGPSTKKRRIKELETELIGQKIPGFFPTPRPVAERLVEKAEIEAGMSVLEPSAGKGDLADVIREQAPDAELKVIELQSLLRKILEAKGHRITDTDFLEHQGRYDRIVMNPPFEKGEDIEHVRHAYGLLNPGGRVVAVISEGSFFRNDKKSIDFRDWLESIGGENEKLPESSFKGTQAFRQTGVAAQLVVIDRPETLPAPPSEAPPAARVSLDALNRQIDELEYKMAGTEGELRKELQGELSDLRRRREELLVRKGELQQEVPPYGEEESNPIWFSQIQRTIEEKMPARAPAPQVLALLRSPGIKADEVKWTGIEDWIKQNPRMLTKEEVLDFLRQNEVRVEEVTKGGAPEPLEWYPAEENTWMTWPEIRFSVALLPNGKYRLFDQSTKGSDLHGSLEEAKGAAEEIYQRTVRPTTKFAQYTLPGAKPGTYRELVLTLPGNQAFNRQLEDRLIQALRDAGADDRQIDYFSKNWGSPAAKDLARQLAPEAVEQYEKDFDRYMHKPYRSPHWEEPNVLAHVRFNERTDAEGKQVLFIEEIQSDYAQAARKQGVVGGELLAGYETREVVSSKGERKFKVFGPQGQSLSDTYDSPDEAKQAFLQATGVPPLPFAKNWHELTLKRMLKYASENGYDKLAWITGEQTAERYDLSKQVDTIDWGKMPNGTYHIFAVRAGETVVDKRNLPANQLDDLVGKEVADRIRSGVGRDQPIAQNIRRQFGAEEAGSLFGLDLKVGGEWAKNLYDRMIPQFLTKYGKKWEVKVGKTKINIGDERQRGQIEMGVVPKEYEERILDTVPSIDITPQMRQSVLEEGQALFQRSTPYERPETREIAVTQGKQAVEELTQATPAISTAGGKVARAGAGVRTIGLGIQTDLKRAGWIDLRGYPVKSAEDIAIMARVYRDPRFETFRIFYVQGERIVAHEGLTSRLPATVSVSHPEKLPQFVAKIKQRTERIARKNPEGGLVEYYLLHNHPGGEPVASAGDMAVTKMIASKVPGFKAHVIINHEDYGTITRNPEAEAGLPQEQTGKEPTVILLQRNVTRFSEEEVAPGRDPTRIPEVPHNLLARAIQHEGHMVSVGRQIEYKDQFVTLIYRGLQGQINAIQEMPVALFLRPKEATDFIRGQARRFGSASPPLAYYAGGENIEEAATSLMKQGALVDVVIGEGSPTLRQYGVRIAPRKLFGKVPGSTPRYRVSQEEESELGEFPPFGEIWRVLAR